MGGLAHWGIVAVLVALLFYSPRFLTVRRRLPVAVVLFVLGWGEVFAGLAIKDRAFMHGILVYVWIGSAAAMILLAVVLLSASVRGWFLKGLFRRRIS